MFSSAACVVTKRAEPSSTASSIAPILSSSTAKAIGSGRPRSQPPNASRPARAELPHPVHREDRVHEPPDAAIHRRPSRPLRRGRREVDRLPPQDRALVRELLLPNRSTDTTTQAMSDRPTSGRTSTRRSESSPAPVIATTPHRCSPFMRTSTQPLTLPPGREGWKIRSHRAMLSSEPYY